MQITVEQIENEVKQLSPEDLRRVRDLVDSLLESDDIRLRKMREYVDAAQGTRKVKKSVEKAKHLRESLLRKYD